MKSRTLQQNSRLHKLLSSTGLVSEKATLVLHHTKGRSSSSADLSFAECAALIAQLEGGGAAVRPTVPDQAGRANQMRRQILSYAHQMRWELDGSTKVDMERVNAWCEKYGYLHKKLNDYSYSELPKLVTQFSNMLDGFIRATATRGN